MQNRNKSLLSKSQRRCITGEFVEKIFPLVYAMLENPVALYDEEYGCLHSNDPTLSEFTMKEDAEVFVPNIITEWNSHRVRKRGSSKDFKT